MAHTQLHAPRINLGNVVCSTEGEIELVWIDWECATPVGSIARSLERIGTIDTMSVEALEGFSVVHEPYQELESGVYLVWKLTMTNRRLVIRAEDKAKFAEVGAILLGGARSAGHGGKISPRNVGGNCPDRSSP